MSVSCQIPQAKGRCGSSLLSLIFHLSISCPEIEKAPLQCLQVPHTSTVGVTPKVYIICYDMANDRPKTNMLGNSFLNLPNSA